MADLKLHPFVGLLCLHQHIALIRMGIINCQPVVCFHGAAAFRKAGDPDLRGHVCPGARKADSLNRQQSQENCANEPMDLFHGTFPLFCFFIVPFSTVSVPQKKVQM